MAGLLSTIPFKPAARHPEECLPWADAVLAALPEPTDPPADDFWDDIVRPNGVRDHAQVMRELADYRVVMHEVGRVYDEVTFGRFSKPNTAAVHIIDRVNERLSESYDEGHADALAALPEYEQVQRLVDEQAEDEGIWFIPMTAAEAYLQQELRRLHEAVETLREPSTPKGDQIDRMVAACPPGTSPESMLAIEAVLRETYERLVEADSTPKVEADDWHPDVLAENAHARIDPPEVCPTCGSDDPEEPGVVSAHDPACWGNCERHGCPVPTFCPDPFHSQGEPCDLCGGTGCWLACDDEWCDTLSHVEPCPRGCNPGEPEGATP